MGLIEVVIAITIMLLVLVPVCYLLVNVISDTGGAVQKTAALSIAEQWIETLNSQGAPPVDPPVNNTPEVNTNIPEGTQSEGNITYTVSAYFQWADLSPGLTTPDLCTSTTLPQVLALTVTVTWSGGSGSVTDSTILDFPPPALPTDGFIAIQLEGDPAGSPPGLPAGSPPNDAAGRTWGEQSGVDGRIESVPVTLTPSSGPAQTLYPDAFGCVFAEEAPGTYGVTVGAETLTTPFVEEGSTTATTVSASTTVTVNQVSLLGPYFYDEGAFTNVNYPNSTVTDDGVSCPNTAQFQCLVTGQTPTGSATNGSSGIEATATVLSGSTWGSSAAISGISRIESTACGSICIGVGYTTGPAGAAVTDSTSAPGSWATSTLPSGISALTQIKCPQAGDCVAIGSGTTSNTPVIVSGVDSTTSVTWTNDTLPSGPNNPTALSQITCPSATTCLALGSGSTGPVILGGTLSGSTWTWVSDPLPGGLTSLLRVTCPATSTACLVAGSAPSGAVILAGTQSGATQTWNLDNLTNSPTSLTQLTCSGTTACLAIGTTSTGPTLIAGPVSSSGGQAWSPDTLPTGVTSLNQITCSGSNGTTACLAIDSTSAGNDIIAGPVSPNGGKTWVADTLPTGVNVVGQINCPATASQCVATGSTGTGNASAGIIMTGNVTTSTQSFVAGSVPSSSSPVYYTGLSCYVSGSLICAAPGASQTASILMSTSTVLPPPLQTTWSSVTVNSPGLFASNLPISVSNSQTNTFFVACTAGTCPSPSGSIGPLFPFASGYSIGAGNCSQELLNAAAQTTSVPGTSSATAPTETLPLGLLPIEVVNSSGLPIPGATVTATVDDPALPNGVACNGAPGYVMPTTGPDGLSRMDVMYETYTISVHDSNGTTNNVGTIQVNSSTDTLNPGVTQTVSAMPSAVVVVGP
ncbi:MAG: hypothetical protein ACLP9C_05865 [Acidimicrobiales bacterium]